LIFPMDQPGKAATTRKGLFKLRDSSVPTDPASGNDVMIICETLH
jgi:hypothetical protein